MEQTNPLDSLFVRAAAHGVPMSRICKAAGIAETTPSRWRNGKNKPMFDKIITLNAALDAILAEESQAAA